MDLARQNSDNFGFERFIGYIFYIPGIWLIIHTISVWKNTNGLVGFPSVDALNDFRKYRDLFYLIFVFIGVVLGVASLLKKDSSVKFLIPCLIIGLIIITFSYSAAGLIVDLSLIISKII